MLVPLTNVKGETQWINPLHVIAVRERKGRAEVQVLAVPLPIRVERSAREVADDVSAALSLVAGAAGGAAVAAATERIRTAEDAGSAGVDLGGIIG